MLVGVASFLLLTYLSRLLPVSPLSGQLLAAFVWLVLWVAGGYLTSRRLYESAIFFNLLLFAFIDNRLSFSWTGNAGKGRKGPTQQGK